MVRTKLPSKTKLHKWYFVLLYTGKCEITPAISLAGVELHTH